MRKFLRLFSVAFFIGFGFYAAPTTAQCLEGSCDNGEGKFRYGDNTLYEGSFKNGKADGYGVCMYSNGCKYEGEWQEHNYNGKGILTYKSGRRVAGIWASGKLTQPMPADDVQQSLTTSLMRSMKPLPTPTVQPPSNDYEQQAVAPATYSKLSSGTSEEGGEEENPTKIWAVIVGVAAYQHLPMLNYTDDDAYRMYAFLRSPEGGAVPDEQIKIVVDEYATRKNILKSMEMVYNDADSNDVVLFYFSGHGLNNAFLPIDYNGQLNRIRHQEITSLLMRSRAKFKVCIADACYAGSLDIPRGEIFPQDIYKKTNGGLALMMSSKAEEISIENAGLRQGIFTHFLIKGLKGEADENRNNVVTIREAFEFVNKNVQQFTKNLQNPVLVGDFDDGMPIGIVR